VLSPIAATAQGRPWHVNFGGGPTFNAGETGKHFDTGWGPAIGVAFDIRPNVGIQFEYAYRYFNVSDGALPPGASSFSANHQTNQLDFNIVANLAHSPVRTYVIAGPGMYHRKVEITEYVGNGVICDPYWYVCGTYPIEAVVGSRGGWDFGFNFGGGIGIPIGDQAEFIIEARYHYVWGPNVDDLGGIAQPKDSSSTTKANGSYIPLTFGFRF
jgi:hypothetical protein